MSSDKACGSKIAYVERGTERWCLCVDLQARKELIGRTFDYVMVSEDFLGKIKNVDVVEDFQSRPHEAVTFKVV